MSTTRTGSLLRCSRCGYIGKPEPASQRLCIVCGGSLGEGTPPEVLRLKGLSRFHVMFGIGGLGLALSLMIVWGTTLLPNAASYSAPAPVAATDLSLTRTPSPATSVSEAAARSTDATPTPKPAPTARPQPTATPRPEPTPTAIPNDKLGLSTEARQYFVRINPFIQSSGKALQAIGELSQLAGQNPRLIADVSWKTKMVAALLTLQITAEAIRKETPLVEIEDIQAKLLSVAEDLTYIAEEFAAGIDNISAARIGNATARMAVLNTKTREVSKAIEALVP